MIALGTRLRHREKAYRAIYALPELRVKPEEFCERWFDAESEDKQARGYRARCVELLARVTGVGFTTVDHTWGSGYTFEKMPKQYEQTLQYADTLRLVLLSAGSGAPEILDVVLERLGRKKPEEEPK